jgi:acetolactate synthase-1/2/3 large subunit
MSTIETIQPEVERKVESVQISGADAVVESLIQEGVAILFGYPGGAIMPVYDSFYRYQESITHILTRHEQGAIHAAQGYARSSGKVGVVIATSGPGATNLITGIADAQIDSTPLVCITGQVASHLLGTDAFQETDVIGVSMPVTKWNYQVTTPEEIPEALAKAFYIAKSGRPGPVVIDITKDAQIASFDFSYKKCDYIRSYKPVPDVRESAIERAAHLINNAKKPFLIWGQGIILSEGEKELKELIEKADIPSASTVLGLSALPTEHSHHKGMVGMHGNYGPNILTNECDVLIAVGMRFDDRVTGDLSRYAKQAKVIHIEIDAAEIDKNVKCEIALLGDAKLVMQKLLPQVQPNKHEKWHGEFDNCELIEKEKVINEDFSPSSEELSMGEVINEINQLTGGDAIVVTDVGQHQMIASRYAKFNQTKSSITSGGLGTMGFCLPAAIGAKFATPDRQVIAVIGDGGFQMTIQELGTLMQTGIAVKVVILNNEFLGMVRQWQELFFEKRYAATEMQNPDFIAIAKGYRIDGQTVSDRKDLKEALAEMLSSKGSYVLDVRVKKEGNVFPMIQTGSSVSEIRLS